jgi:hypothetical protein
MAAPARRRATVRYDIFMLSLPNDRAIALDPCPSVASCWITWSPPVFFERSPWGDKTRSSFDKWLDTTAGTRAKHESRGFVPFSFGLVGARIVALEIGFQGSNRTQAHLTDWSPLGSNGVYP